MVNDEDIYINEKWLIISLVYGLYNNTIFNMTGIPANSTDLGGRLPILECGLYLPHTALQKKFTDFYKKIKQCVSSLNFKGLSMQVQVYFLSHV